MSYPLNVDGADGYGDEQEADPATHSLCGELDRMHTGKVACTREAGHGGTHSGHRRGVDVQWARRADDTCAKEADK